MKYVHTTLLGLVLATCAALATPSQAATYDDFSTDPNIAGDWTQYAYYNSDSVTNTGDCSPPPPSSDEAST